MTLDRVSECYVSSSRQIKHEGTGQSKEMFTQSGLSNRSVPHYALWTSVNFKKKGLKKICRDKAAMALQKHYLPTCTISRD